MLFSGQTDITEASPGPEKTIKNSLTPAAVALLLLLGSEPLTISSAVRILSREFPCSRSTAWSAAARLCNLGLISKSPERAVELTKAGRAMLFLFQKEPETGGVE